MATENRDQLDRFYDRLQTLPGLIGNLGLSIAEAQRRLDQNYIESLTAFTKMISTLGGGSPPTTGSAAQFLELFRAIAPSHYQFTETAVEVRADLRVASASELQVGGQFGINKGIFSATVNFSYLKRSGSDYQASAALRSVINAIPADHAMLNELLARAGTPITAQFKADASFKAMMEALSELKELPPAPKP
jgi:hypothetical protein